MQGDFTFIDLFAGIGGFHLAMHNVGGKCVYVSEWDKYARQTYEKNFSKISPEVFEDGLFVGDITDPTNKALIPDFDVVCAGFPCQPFSQAGFKRGFEETRGTLFFDIKEIIKTKKPKAFFLENVRHLLKHNDGETFKVIEKTLRSLGYTFDYKIVKASDHGLPTHRPRLFMVGFRKDLVPKNFEFKFPNSIPLKFTMSDVLGGKCNRDMGYTLRVGGRGSGLKDRRNWDSYLVNGKERRLTSREGLKIMGFPEDFVFPVSEAQAMKQLGNSVAVDAIQATAKEMAKILTSLESKKAFVSHPLSNPIVKVKTPALAA